ncbi:MAG: glycosyl transferase group 1 [Solirubrobacterales bacterium]|nr:glycosyl transferase group 1 [Solirubrobacterales bacterium]
MRGSIVGPVAKSTRSTLLAVASQGPGSGDERRLVALLDGLDVELWPFDRSSKVRAAWALFLRLLHAPPELLVIEGTGLGACLPALAAGSLRRVPFVVSSGDAVGPFFRLRGRAAGLVGGLYERWLCRCCAGYIGWTPYLVGRALTFGAPRAMTAENWADLHFDAMERVRVRNSLAVPHDAVVFGIVGSLTWSAERDYCYGLELIRAIARTTRPDVRVLIVGDGDGRERLEAASGGDPRIIFTGRVDRTEVGGLLSAMDVGSLPQSRDGVGMFRYTTKLSEYLAADLLVATGRLPFAYDLSDARVLRLPGDAPWEETYIESLSRLMDSALPSSRGLTTTLRAFDRDPQRERVVAFVNDILEETRARKPQ